MVSMKNYNVQLFAWQWFPFKFGAFRRVDFFKILRKVYTFQLLYFLSNISSILLIIFRFPIWSATAFDAYSLIKALFSVTVGTMQV